MTEKETKKFKEEVTRAFKKGYVKALFEEGKSVSEIAKRAEVSATTVRSWIKKF